MKTKIVSALAVGMVLSACSASTKNVGSLVLPTSHKTIDVVLHRTDSNECAVGWVLQTYDEAANLLDAKSGSGNALHCQLFQAGIQAGGMVGAAAVLRPSRTNIDNENSQSQGGATATAKAVAKQAQGQLQGQAQGQTQGQGQGQSQTAQGGSGGAGGAGGQGGHGGNNGQGNGDGDGGNPGTDNHHNNGDNN